MKIELKITRAGTIQNLQDREDLQLITDSQDIESINEHIGLNLADEKFDGYFIKNDEGELSEVLGFYGGIPYLYKDTYKVEIIRGI
jgi:hypothetical protein